MNVSQYKFIVNVSAGCFDYISASSDGTWNVKHGGTILEHPFFRFQLQLISMVIIAHFFLVPQSVLISPGSPLTPWRVCCWDQYLWNDSFLEHKNYFFLHHPIK